MALQTLYLFKWNNYRNKIIKGRPQISDGTPYTDSKGGSLLKFNPNDGIDAECVLNLNYNNFEYNYILEVESGTNFTRSWFIKEPIRLSENQVKLILVRDIVSDYLHDTLNTDLVINRGKCLLSDSAIYNTEGFELNQIKKSEILLKDETKTAWIIGYVPLGVQIPAGETEFGTLQEISTATTVSSESALPFFSDDKQIAVLQNFYMTANIDVVLFYGGHEYNTYCIAGTTYNYYDVLTYQSANTYKNIGKYIQQANENDTFNNLSRNLKATTNSDALAEFVFHKTFDTNQRYNLFKQSDIAKYNGKIYYFTNSSKYYKVNIVRYEISPGVTNVNTNQTAYGFNSDINQKIFELVAYDQSSVPISNIGAYDNTKTYGDWGISIDLYKYELEEIKQSATYHIDPNQFNNDNVKVEKQPYKMFAFPVDAGKCAFYYEDENNQNHLLLNDPAIVDAFLSYFTKDNGRILDIQLVPFFPQPELIDFATNQPFINCVKNPRIDIYNSNNDIVSTGIWITTDTFSNFIDVFKEVENFKVENESDFYRLCSPHYEAQFEFKITQTNGIRGIKVEGTYKPYQPYLHLVPYFGQNSLYGDNFPDARGLVTSGGYSLPISSEQWATFARTNSTYQLVFDRQIQNLEVKHKVQFAKEMLGLGGSALGLGMSVSSGNPLGTVGSTAGLIGSLGASYINSMYARPEEKKYQQDIFNYTIQNIKAQPETLTKVTALDVNNRLFPVLEYYSCTDGEKEYLEKYFYYNSYRIGRIGKIKDYIDPNQDYTYIQAEILRMETVIEAHELDYLNEVLKMGVYFKGGLINE